jgi:hypothetical protein
MTHRKIDIRHFVYSTGVLPVGPAGASPAGFAKVMILAMNTSTHARAEIVSLPGNAAYPREQLEAVEESPPGKNEPGEQQRSVARLFP